MYSRFMHRLFGEKTTINGVKIDELLYFEEDREKERNTVRNWLPLAFDPAYDWDLIGGLGPDLVHHRDEAGDLHCRNRFHRIERKDGGLSLMFYIKDVSERIR